MRLGDLLSGLPGASVQLSPEERARPILGVTGDSRRVLPGFLFVAYRGLSVDGHRFVEEAVRRGAAAIVAEDEPPAGLPVPVIRVPRGRRAVGLPASAFYGEPSCRLRVVGVTGTNGKTTTTWLVRHLPRSAGMSCGLVGSVGVEVGDTFHPPTLTAPTATQLQPLLAAMVEGGDWLPEPFEVTLPRSPSASGAALG